MSSRASPPSQLNVSAAKSASLKHLLLYSPVPSPSLPSILPRHGKKPPPLNTRKALRAICWLAIGVTIFWVFGLLRRNSSTLVGYTNLPLWYGNGKSFELVGEDQLPNFATPIAITDHKGRHRWTISIPQHLDFPLPAADYADICAQIEGVAHHVATRHKQDHSHQQSYYHNDRNFIDVDEAIKANLLPRSRETLPNSDLFPFCSQSITYVLDATDAGLGSALLGMWLAYGLAQRENRAFFIDDTQFAYGNYSNYFIPPPSPLCRKPPKAYQVPCPHEAKHLVVSAATTSWTFGQAFQEHYSQQEIFDMAREGYEALFGLRSDDAEYVKHKTLEHNLQRTASDALLVGVHIRRGDRHPFEYTYQRGYFPTRNYLEAVDDIRAHTTSRTTNVIVASDDPEVLNNPDLSGTSRAQDRITLASKSSLKDGSVGWEGGFYKDLFWSLGLPLEAQEHRRLGSPLPSRGKKYAPILETSAETSARDYKTNPTKEALQVRELIGRSYLLDLTTLADSDRIVCAVSSHTCRILAVMMGWDRAINKAHWVNIDGNFEWRGFDI